jgi:hypothetical protein
MQLVGPVVEGPKGSVNGAVSSGTSFGDDVGGGGGAVGGGGQVLLVKNVSKLIAQKYVLVTT